jgi:hypothetical protein
MAKEVWSIDDINERLAELSQQIFPQGLRLYYALVGDLKEQDVNPQSMPQPMLDQLIDNVRSVGALESVPLCVKRGDDVYIISGHHRIRAARAAGVTHAVVLLYEDLDPSRVKSKQLAHNTISGQSDPELVRRVWQQITDVTARLEAFVDPRRFDDIPQPVRFKPVDVDIGKIAKTVLVVFLASQKMDFDAAVKAILPQTELDTVYLAERETYEAWREAFQKVRSDLDIVSVPTAIAEMARLAIKALEQAKTEAESGN